MNDRKLLGELGENLAAAVLYAEGYEIVERNFRCPIGEIDLICRRNDTIFFVEVKTRAFTDFGTPEEAVCRQKQLKIRRIAEYYRKIRRVGTLNVSFQVFGITIQQIENAF